MITMLPSGIATEVWPSLGNHPALGNCVHVVPLSVDRQTSFFRPRYQPPMITMLPSGIATLV
ncbi:hypothetical protein DSECCO2_394990 [anaerobic digester metagenome]